MKDNIDLPTSSKIVCLSYTQIERDILTSNVVFVSIQVKGQSPINKNHKVQSNDTEPHNELGTDS